jgi:hypothetical protein
MIYGYVLGGRTFDVRETRATNKKRNCPVFLRTCRQVYAEAHLIAFSANCFSYHYLDDLNYFMRSRSIRERRAVATVQHQSWSGGRFSPPTANSLQGVPSWFCPNITHVYVVITKGPRQYRYPNQYAQATEAFTRFVEGELWRMLEATTRVSYPGAKLTLEMRWNDEVESLPDVSIPPEVKPFLVPFWLADYVRRT